MRRRNTYLNFNHRIRPLKKTTKHIGHITTQEVFIQVYYSNEHERNGVMRSYRVQLNHGIHLLDGGFWLVVDNDLLWWRTKTA